jgi:transposase-like protein
MVDREEAAKLAATVAAPMPRIEIVSDRRRAHSAEFRAAMVARSLEPGIRTQHLARRNGICASLIYRQEAWIAALGACDLRHERPGEQRARPEQQLTTCHARVFRVLAVSLNRMRCKTGDGETWTTVRVREMRERLGLAEYNSQETGPRMVSLAKAAEQLGICVGSAKSLALKGILPATQAMKGAQWLVPAEALTSEAVRIGVQRVVERRPKIYENYQYDNLVRLPGI